MSMRIVTNQHLQYAMRYFLRRKVQEYVAKNMVDRQILLGITGV